ncbi:MAG: DsbA family protein [Pseudomonadota bacterium]
MTEQFKEQGGAATMDPSALTRWMTSRFVSRLVRPGALERARAAEETARLAAGKPHVVEYFHQVEDGYSHLSSQVLERLQERYDVQLVCHLVAGPQGKNSAEPELLLRLSRYDSQQIAQHYDLQFPEGDKTPPTELIADAKQILAAQDNANFIARCAEVGAALWSTDTATMTQLAEAWGTADDKATRALVETGSARQAELKHYSGGMFYYAGEWYWGIDRLYHLEQRLSALGVDRQPQQPMIAPRPDTVSGPLQDNGSLTLEVFPSLRSPYTAISFDRAVKLARDTGVKLVVKPVLPMVMRGVPATREKGQYIFSDTAREARAAGVPFGKFYDPIGNPARRGYSLYPWACEQGKGNELLSAFLSCAFAEGVNLNREKGLRRAVEKAGLDWSEARGHLGSTEWKSQLEDNRLAMYDAGLWGVPSFRLMDREGREVLALWGQDRLWLIAQKIQQLLALNN